MVVLVVVVFANALVVVAAAEIGASAGKQYLVFVFVILWWFPWMELLLPARLARSSMVSGAPVCAPGG